MTTLEIPKALHRGESELPFVALGDGTHLQLLQVDVEAGLWVIRTRFEPGVTVPTHKHTGEVFAFTITGSWKYVEYPEVNVAGSYLYEPAGSIHTLTVPAENDGLTDVWFAIYGANLNLDADGNVESVIDAGLELGPDHPQAGFDVDLQKLEVGAVAERDERQLLLAAVEGLGNLKCRHAPMKPRERRGYERRRRPASSPVCSPCSMKTAPLTIVAS